MKSVPRAAAIATLLASLLASLTAVAAMPRREPPLILGGATQIPRPVVVLDPRLPTGTRVGGAPRPAAARAICSLRRPLCVHAPAQLEAEAGVALAALEHAYESVVLAAGLPAPKADLGLGGSDALDAYLVSAHESLRVVSDVPALGAFSESSGFCELPLADGVLLARSATLCIGEAIALRLDASEPPHLRRAFATWLWWLVGQPTSLDAEAIDEVQSHPERAIASRELSSQSEGSALFFEYLESARSSRPWGELSAALFGTAVSSGRKLGIDYDNEPDLFDVLRHSLSEERDRFAALMVDFAVARAFVGARDDGLHLPALAWSGNFGKLRTDWVVKFSSLPRRVLVNPALDSTGSVVVWLDMDEVGLGAALGVHIDWEPPVSFQWQIVKVGPKGEEVTRIDVPFQERGHEVDARLQNLDGASAVLIVGTNLEGIDLAHPFDPDVAPFEPHSATVYLARM
ncbi:MAG: hypothetical protein ACOY0T_07580 [Myxococcota bacterium]